MYGPDDRDYLEDRSHHDPFNEFKRTVKRTVILPYYSLVDGVIKLSFTSYEYKNDSLIYCATVCH